ncbi:GNAT family N-acetyltransferase [Elioraea sp.]|uniref:GNAT family N-acetyltransferase n=1 Tax=Elioraea sp. TaxID=2185103 RepID=UPI003F6FBF4C
MAPPIHPLAEADLDTAFALSTAAGWNQTIADWRHFLRDGSVWGIEADGVLAASAAVLPFGPTVAWVSMVLTLPEHRGRGHATALMAHALAALAASGHRAVLDATPFGQPVYTKLGLAPFWSFRRWRLDATGSAVPGVRPLRPGDWPEILALDAAANGMPRERLLRAIAARLPAAARVAVAGMRIEGFALARDGRLAPQIGPVIARDGRSAQRLIAAALAALPAGQSVVIDLADAQAELAAWLAGRGASPQRPFTRMAMGTAPLPGDASLIIAPVGPEFG